MGEVEGPYERGSINSDVTVVTANNMSDPVVIECMFTFYNPNKSRYRYELYIDVLDPTPVGRPPIRRMIDTMHYNDMTYNFTSDRQSATMCSQDSNKTCVAYHVFFGPNTPTLIAKCILKYSPFESFGTADAYEVCSSLTTMIIIPNYTHSTSELPYSTLQPSSTRSSPIIPTANLENDSANLSIAITTITFTLSLVFALCLPVGIIIILAGSLFLKYKRRQTDFTTKNKTFKNGFLFKLGDGDNNDLLSKLGDEIQEKPEQKVETSEFSTISTSAHCDVDEKLPGIISSHKN